MDLVDQKDHKNVDEDSTEEEGTCTSSKGRLEKEHLDDQIIESPLKRKKKFTKIIIAQTKFVSTKTQAIDMKTQQTKQSTQDNSR